MTKTRRIAIWTTVLVVGAAASIATPAAAQDPAEDTDDATTPTTTHIEYSPFGGLVKIELPRVPRPGDVFEPEKGKKGARAGVNGAFLSPLLAFRVQKEQNLFLAEVQVLHVPFMKVQDPCALLESVEKDKPQEKNPFDSQIDQPLVSLYDFVGAARLPEKDKAKRTETGTKKTDWAVSSVRWLDSPVFCLSRHDRWGEDRYAYEWFKVPLLSVFARTHTPKSSSRSVLDGPIVTGFSRKISKEMRKTEMLDLFVAGTVYKRACKTGEKPSDKGAILHTPPASIVKWKHEGEKRSLSVLDVGFDTFDSSVRFIAYRADRLEDGTRTCRILSLPLLGPVWSSWRNDSEAHTGPFPRLISRRWPKEAR